uniref:Integral membrane protein n=1 Tax=Streptomyces sp. NBC_01393 TaxID=2903851 RepID=A0AAU3I0R2_9ACTN
MYGHDGAPPTRSAGTVITLRVLFAAAGLLSCGLLACVPLFRVAIQRGRWFDWTAAWVSLPVSIGALMIVGTVPESDSRGDVALTVALILGAGSVAYYLASDIRFHNAGRRPIGYAPIHPRTAPGPYGHPQPAPPALPYPGLHVPQVQPQPPVPQAYPPNTPMPQPPPQRATPARIDQVRAELDELSDYLRRHGDRRDGDHEGGR